MDLELVAARKAVAAPGERADVASWDMGERMKCLVTGGAGFIGSHLVDRLIAEGHDVTVIDDLSTGRRENVNPAARFFQWDIANPDAWHAYDWIFHLAGRADIVPSIWRPTGYYHANVTTTMEVLDAANFLHVKRVIYAASSSCYGVNPPLPTAETAPIACAHPYALTKRLGEELVLHYGQVYGLPVVSLRLFNIYGPRARTSGAYGAVMGTFLAQRANGLPLTIVGDGTQRRDFVWVDDVVTAFIRAAESDATGVFNIGAGRARSVQELADLIGGPQVHVPARGGEPAVTCADIRQAMIVLGWYPRVELEEGVARLLADLTPWKDAPAWTPKTIAEATKVWHATLG